MKRITIVITILMLLMPLAALAPSAEDTSPDPYSLSVNPTPMFSTVPVLAPPINRSLETGTAATLTWMINNPTTSSVAYNLALINDPVNAWFSDAAGASGLSALTPLSVGAQSSASFDISVTVPGATPRGTAATAIVTATPNGGGDVLTESVTVMARDTYNGTIDDNNTAHTVLPGENGTVRYTITNTGTAPSEYLLTSGIIQAPEGWLISIEGETEQPYRTGIIQAGAQELVTVTVRPASLTMPLNPLAMLTQGLQVSLRTTSTPVGGGGAASDTTVLEVGGAIAAAVTPDVEEFSLDESELLAHSISKFVGVTVQLQHNLPALPSGATATVNLTVDSPLIHPSTNGAGASEQLRWNGTVSPPYHESLSIQEEVRATAGVLGPIDDYPVAGDLEFTVRATITNLSGIGVAVNTPPGLANFTIKVPEIVEGSVSADVNGTGQPGLASSMSVNISNLGNDAHNFTVSASGPEGWTVSISQPNVTDLEARPADWPNHDGSENRSVTIVVTPHPDALAETAHPIGVVLRSAITGRVLDGTTAYFEVGEVFGAAIEPAEVTTSMQKGQVGSLVLGLNNTGNSNQTFDLALSSATPDLQVSLLDGNSLSVGPRSVGPVRVQVVVSADARADEAHGFQVILSKGGAEVGRSAVTISVGAEHNLIFVHNATFAGTPGTPLSIPFTVANDGNQRESLSFQIDSDENWTSEYSPQNLFIEPKAPPGLVIANLHIPPLDTSNFLAAGEVHNITLKAIETATGDVIGTSTFTVEIQPFFILRTIEKPDRIAVLPGESKTVDYVIANEGNQDVTVNIDCGVDSSRFTYSTTSCPTAPMFLPMGQSVTISPTFGANANDHFDGESGWFTMTFTPTSGIGGGMSQEQTKIEVVRILADDEILVRSTNGRTQIFQIPWMHVPGQGHTSDTGQKYYQLTPNQQERIIDPANYGNESVWDLEMALSNGSSQSVSQSMILGPISPYGSDKIDLKVTLPPLGKVPPGDGWNLSFILTNIAESTLTHFTIKLRVDEYTDPMVAAVDWSNDTLLESQPGTLVATILNDGTAVFPVTAMAHLSCSNDDLKVLSATSQMIPGLAPGESAEVTWNVTAPALGWWSPTEPVGCEVSILLPGQLAGNDVENDVYSSELVVTSWAPPGGIWTAAPITILLLAGTVMLRRRGKEDERMMHLSAYTAAAMFAAITYLATDPMVAPYLQSDPALTGVLAYAGAGLTILFTLWIAWRSSSELQAIHDDRRKAVTGGRPEISGHEQELANTRRQLRAILSMPPLLFLFLMIATPDMSISFSPINLGTIAAYALLAPMIIAFMLSRMDKAYGRVNTALGELEMRTLRIKEIVNASDSPRTRLFADDAPPPPPDIPPMDEIDLDEGMEEFDDYEEGDYNEFGDLPAMDEEVNS